MSFTLAVSAFFACLALLLVKADSSEKFLLKKNLDGTYLLVPAPANASKETTVDIKSLPPIAVEGSTLRDAPGVNSQSPPAPAPVNTPVVTAPSGEKVSSDSVLVRVRLFYSIQQPINSLTLLADFLSTLC